MKKKKLAVLAAIVAIIMVGAVSASFAATNWQTPAEILSGLTGKSVDEVQSERQAGSPYGAQAEDSDVLEAFKTARLEQFRARLDEAVAQGDLTQEEADARYDYMVERQALCLGGGLTGGIAGADGDGFGFGMGGGRGRGSSQVRGACMG